VSVWEDEEDCGEEIAAVSESTTVVFCWEEESVMQDEKSRVAPRTKSVWQRDGKFFMKEIYYSNCGLPYAMVSG